MPRSRPEGYHSLTPQIIAADARETIDFVQKVFDAATDELYEENGRVAHAEVVIGDSKLMIASASDEFPVFPLMTNVYVEDVDATYARAISQGATSLRPPEDQFYGDRTGGVLDSQGNQWWISTHIEDVSDDELRRRMAEMNG